MAAGGVGYWGTRYWSNRWWHEEYWAESGAAPPPPPPPPPPAVVAEGATAGVLTRRQIENLRGTPRPWPEPDEEPEPTTETAPVLDPPPAQTRDGVAERLRPPDRILAEGRPSQDAAVSVETMMYAALDAARRDGIQRMMQEEEQTMLAMLLLLLDE